MGTAVIIFQWMLLLFTSKLSEAVFNRKPECYSLLNKEDVAVEDMTPILRNKHEAAVSLHEYAIDIKKTLPSSEMLQIENLINNVPFPVPVNTQLYSFDITSATITTVCDKVHNCASGYMWSPGICSAYQSCSNIIVGETCGCVTQVPSNATCEPELINSTMATSISTVGTSLSAMMKTELTSVMESAKSTETSPSRQTTSTITPSGTLTVPTGLLMTSVSTALSTNLTTPAITPASATATSVTIVTSTSMISPTSKSPPKLSSQIEMLAAISVTETMSSVNTMLTTTSESKSTMPTLMSETLLPTMTPTPLTSVMTSKTLTATAAAQTSVITATIPTLMSTAVTSPSSMTTPLTSMIFMTSANVTSPITQTSMTTLKITTSEADPTTQAVIIPMFFSIDESFTDSLRDNTTEKYKKYSSDINNALNISFKSFPGFQWARVKEFSNGSVTVSYEVAGSETNPTPEDITMANEELLNELPEYKITPSSFTAIVGRAFLRTETPVVSDGDAIVLYCYSGTEYRSYKYSIKWYLEDRDLQRNGTTLSIKATEEWNGAYACEYVYGDVKTDPGRTNISVIPVPNRVITYDATFVYGKDGGTTQNITCCVDKGNAIFYNVTLSTTTGLYSGQPDQSNPQCYIFKYTLGNWTDESATCIVTNILGKEKSSSLTISFIQVAEEETLCNDTQFGLGENGKISTKPCTGNQVGIITANCVNRTWSGLLENCTSVQLLTLLERVKNFNNSPTPINENLPKVLKDLANLSQNKSTNITSVGNLAVMVTILEEISFFPVQNVEKVTMTDFLISASSILENTSNTNWLQLNNIDGSSRLLSAVENFTKRFAPGTKDDEILTENIVLKSTQIFPNETSLTYNKSFFNNGIVEIPVSELTPLSQGLLLVISIGFKTLGNILPLNIAMDANNTSNFTVNGILMSTNVKSTINKIKHTFQKTNNKSLNTPKCVFWDFTQLEWNDFGCEPEMGNYAGDIIICTCNHLTSFSILMSYKDTDIPQFLDWVTYIGLGISIGSLVICLLLEGLVWKSITKNKTSYIRHVSIVNIAMSLLIADIWFIIGLAIKEGGKMTDTYDAACKAATFLIHFFYLSLFFWMFAMGLLLFYRLVFVFHDMSRTTMMIIAFSLGYGGPLIISIITIAITAPDKYIRTNACWLNWDNSKALLAFIIPALTIVATNVVFLLVVIIKIMRPTVGERPRSQEKNTMVQIARSVAILTPLLGLTWGFGIATVVAGYPVFHIIFTILNAFQGLFILIVGTLIDSKVRDAFLQILLSSRWVSQQTKSTSSGSLCGQLSRAIDNMLNRKGNKQSDETNSSSNVSPRPYSVSS